MAGMDALGRVFNVVPAAAGLYINMQDCSGVTFVCTSVSSDTFAFGEAKTSGGGTAFIDVTVVNGRHSTSNPDGGPNGPGCGGLAIGSRKIEMKVGDVLIVPPGVVHGWSDIPDHVDYLSFRPSHGVMKNGWVNPTIASK